MPRSSSSSPPPTPSGPRPLLSPAGERELVRVVEVLAAHGVFAPRAPDPAQLREAVADAGEPVLAEAVLSALHEADHYHPGFVMSEHAAGLSFHSSHTEQFAETLRGQVDDLVRLAGDGLAGVAVTVEVGEHGPTGRVPTRIRITADGGERVLDYAGAPKYLSTVLHEALARLLRERATGRRLAWLWNDQGAWITSLREGDVERLDAALGAAAGEGWEWVDEQPPTAAGEMYPEAPRDR